MEDARKKLLCDRLSSLTPARSKEIYVLIQDYNRKHEPQLRTLGSGSVLPYGARRNGSDYVFDLERLPAGLVRDIETLLREE